MTLNPKPCGLRFSDQDVLGVLFCLERGGGLVGWFTGIGFRLGRIVALCSGLRP